MVQTHCCIVQNDVLYYGWNAKKKLHGNNIIKINGLVVLVPKQNFIPLFHFQISNEKKMPRMEVK